MPSATTALYPVVRGLIATTLLLLVGLQVAHGIIARRTDTIEPALRQQFAGWLLRLPGALAWFLLMLSLGRGALQVLSFVDPGDPITPDLLKGVLWQGAWGTAWMLQSAAAFLLLALSWLLRDKEKPLRFVMLVLVALLLWAETGIGHAADEIWGSSIGRVVAFVHLVGAGYWLGTLAALALIVFPALRGASHLPVLAAVVRDFSIPARLGALLVLLSGASATWTYAGSLDGVLTSAWGRLLLIKLGVLAGVAIAGAWNWKVVTPALEQGHEIAPARLRRAVVLELLFGAVVLAVTALLVASPLPGHDG